VSDREFTSPVFDSGLFTTFTVYVDKDRVLAVPLRPGVDYPLAPKSDVEESGAANGEPEGGGEAGGEDEAPAIDIVIDGFEDRAIQLPIERGELDGLSVNGQGQLLYLRGRGGVRNDVPGLRLFDPSDRTKSEETVADGVRWFMVSGDGAKVLVLKQEGGPPNLFQELSGAVGGTMAIIDAAPDQKLDAALDLSGLQATIDPREEWRQIFRETWRTFRDSFYDPGMHGVDWNGVHSQYGRMLEDAASRGDLHYILGEMVAELNAGHTYVYHIDTSAPAVSVGMLGADFELHDGAYRFKKIYRGGPWDTDARGPLGDWYTGVKEGDYLLAVNGLDVDTRLSPWAPFQGLAGKTVRLTVGASPQRDDSARQVDVATLPGDLELRYRAWIEKNRAYVEEKTGGRAGYMHVPDCMPYGLDNFSRQFFHERRRDALIIDERWNGGGYFSTRYIEALNRQVHYYAGMRSGALGADPAMAHYGPKAMLINSAAGSDGDLFPAKFRQRKLGKLIGTRTWGGVIGILGNPQPIDGGMMFVANISTYTKDSEWTIEGHGVDPDIEVVEDPAKMTDGKDPQLDAAIRQILEELESSPHVVPPMPEYPDRSGLAE
jgi:tricorn protease